MFKNEALVNVFIIVGLPFLLPFGAYLGYLGSPLTWLTWSGLALATFGWMILVGSKLSFIQQHPMIARLYRGAMAIVSLGLLILAIARSQ